MSKRKMSLQQAADLVDDDLPDGAFWAMAHELAGAEYGDAWDELDGYNVDQVDEDFSNLRCPVCGKQCKSASGVLAHYDAKHPDSPGAVKRGKK